MLKLLPSDITQRTRLIGRWVIKKIKGQSTLYTTNLGSLIKFQVKGGHKLIIHVLNNGNPSMPSQRWAIRVNHGQWQRYSADTTPFKVQLPLMANVEIMTAGNTDFDDVWFGNQGLAITALEFDNQAAIQPTLPQNRLTIIGDSITAGCWVNGKQPSIDYRPETCYAGLLADRLSLDIERIAYSAGGVLRPATGNVPVASQFLTRIDDQTAWRPRSMPKLVLINLGVNDRRYPTSQFQNAYYSFIQQVQQVYPDVSLALMVPFAQNFAEIIQQTAKKSHAILIQTKHWCTSFTDNLHPDQTGSRQIVDHLTPILDGIIN